MLLSLDFRIFRSDRGNNDVKVIHAKRVLTLFSKYRVLSILMCLFSISLGLLSNISLIIN